MKVKSILLFVLFTFLPSSCKVRETEVYVSKKDDTESVFDKIDVPNKEEREKLEKETDEKNNEVKEPDKKDNQKPAEEEKPVDAKPAEEKPTEEKTIEENQDNKDKKQATTTSLVNMRTEPLLSETNIITTLDEGAKLEVLEEGLGDNGTWLRVLYDGQEGFISSDFVTQE